jgi:polar amino acid transport system substrate-binding protein
MFINKLSLLVFIYMAFISNAYAEETWKIASLSWPPYSGPELADQGHSIKKLTELLKKENITLIVEFYPWQRAKYLVQTDPEYLGIFPAWPEDAFEHALISPAIDWSEIAVLKLPQQTLNFDSIDQLLKEHPVGVVGTYIYPKVFDDAIKKYPHHVEFAPNEFSLLMKLSSGRGLAAITDPKVMRHLAEKEGIENLEAIFVMKKELVLAFRDDEENRRRFKILTQLLNNSVDG